MLKVIYKYDLQAMEVQYVDLPVGAKLLCVQVQHERIALWALVTPQHELEKRKITMLFTLGRYLGTVQKYGGNLMLHFFAD